MALSIETVRRYYEAFNASDWDGMLACLSDDVLHNVNEGGQRQGKAPFEAFLMHMARCYREELTDIAYLSNGDGSRAAAEFIVNGEYLETDGDLPPAQGQRYRLPAGGFFTLESGLITRVTTYYNLQDWLAQISRT